MDLIYKSISDLKPYENNPRNNDDAVGPVAESIKEFGFKVPMIIDKNDVIVAGHTRYKAAKMLGIGYFPDMEEKRTGTNHTIFIKILISAI